MSSRSDAVFAPHQDVAARIIRQIEATRTRIDAAIFTVTFDRLTRALLAARQRGVAIRLLTDNDKALDLGSDIARLSHADLDVRIDRTEVHMHHKFAIFDGEVLLTGSFNWTRSANEENHENALFTDDAALVRLYQAEFERCWKLGIPY
ncbi:MAG: endonuclease [Deltaproteobacteria bacterium]|nr:endonuclease [Deltaproteobacteria bacterium]